MNRLSVFIGLLVISSIATAQQMAQQRDFPPPPPGPYMASGMQHMQGMPAEVEPPFLDEMRKRCLKLAEIDVTTDPNKKRALIQQLMQAMRNKMHRMQGPMMGSGPEYRGPDGMGAPQQSGSMMCPHRIPPPGYGAPQQQSSISARPLTQAQPPGYEGMMRQMEERQRAIEEQMHRMRQMLDQIRNRLSQYRR